jgi:hypothetical protein
MKKLLSQLGPLCQPYRDQYQQCMIWRKNSAIAGMTTVTLQSPLMPTYVEAQGIHQRNGGMNYYYKGGRQIDRCVLLEVAIELYCYACELGLTCCSSLRKTFKSAAFTAQQLMSNHVNGFVTAVSARHHYNSYLHNWQVVDDIMWFIRQCY